ncbi:hypothetical protein Q5P01_020803 [Channa striata]|uniref:Uncharacterized protein n=1 Tax=Channa striata TaxID=64152 RepID=A0AA88LYX9_CHASR|nr:hypothetical protein Q5P01_020803 [Channa striata]
MTARSFVTPGGGRPRRSWRSSKASGSGAPAAGGAGASGQGKRSAEENNRLVKLSLEWQFQKRLQEIQQRGEDEEEDEDLDTMVIIQQLDILAQVKHHSGENVDSELNELKKPAVTELTQTRDKANADQRSSGVTQDVQNMACKENQEEKIKRASAPEKLTFKERQRLFSPASSA